MQYPSLVKPVMAMPGEEHLLRLWPFTFVLLPKVAPNMASKTPTRRGHDVVAPCIASEAN